MITQFILKKWPGGHELIKMFSDEAANTNISLQTYTCTSYFPEYIVYNKCENVNIMFMLKKNKTNKHHNKQS